MEKFIAFQHKEKNLNIFKEKEIVSSADILDFILIHPIVLHYTKHKRSVTVKQNT
jgi:hypothetical protein